MNTNVQVSEYGLMPNGDAVMQFTLKNANGLLAKIINYGTIITELHVPDRDGGLADVVLGFDALESYLEANPYFGCTVGRVANRIRHGKFTLEGKTWTLAVNNGPNHLHGGVKGFDKVLWKAEPLEGSMVRFTYRSVDGEEGYPGNLDVAVTMGLTDSNELTIDYRATCDQATIINLTNHTAFNLAGDGPILDHELMISGDHFTPVDEFMIPTGEILPVRGTPMDFTTPQAIGSRFSQLQGNPVGYDHNYVINRAGNGLALAARVAEPRSGRVMETHTTQPGMQLYTGNFLDGSAKGKGGIAYEQHTGFSLETQHYPDSINHPGFPSTVLRPRQTYHHVTVYKFLTR